MLRRTLVVVALAAWGTLTLASQTVPAPLSQASRAASLSQLVEPQNLRKAILNGAASHGQLQSLAARHALLHAVEVRPANQLPKERAGLAQL